MIPAFDESIITYYTEGWCWNLAWHLHRLGGFPLITIGGYTEWGHVVVKIGRNQYLDITGIHTRAELTKEWGDRWKNRGPFSDRSDYVWTLFDKDWETDQQDRKPSQTVAIARQLVEAVK